MIEMIARGAVVLTVVIALALGPLLSMLDHFTPPKRGVAVFLFASLGAGVTLTLLYLFRQRISAGQLRRIPFVLATSLAALFLCVIGWYMFSEQCIIYADRPNRPYEEPFVYFPLYLNGEPWERVEHFKSRAAWASDNTPDTVRDYLKKMEDRILAYGVTDAVLFFLCFATGCLVVFEIGLPSVYLAATCGVIRDLASRLGAEHGEFERVVLKKIGFTNVRRFAAQLLERARCVCRFELPRSMGTAFLVGPDLILTNNHIIKDLLADGGVAGRVVVRFDQDELLLGTGDATSREYHLANDWLVERSEALDYALLRLSAPAGQVDITDATTKIPRGWVRLKASDVEAGESLFILQHPRGEPLRLAVGSVVAQVADTNEVTYTTNTDRGSSGSPCLDTRLDLVALHYWGSSELNRGRLISAILEDLKAKNKLQLLPVT